MRGVYGNARQRVAIGAETRPFNVAPLIILAACAALAISVIKNERALGKG